MYFTIRRPRADYTFQEDITNTCNVFKTVATIIYVKNFDVCSILDTLAVGLHVNRLFRQWIRFHWNSSMNPQGSL